MNTKLLKQKILDLAIRGKLTDQCKSDGTARELLERISVSRVLVRSAKSAKSKDLKQIIPLDKSEAPFEIPANWEWVRLGDVGKWQSGTTPSKSNSAYYKDGTIPWLNTGDLNDGIINDIPKRVTEKALAETSLRLNEAGSVCIAMYGATIGKLGILSMPATTNQACCVCNNLKSFVNRMWLFFFLMNHKQEFIEAGFGGAQPNISKEKIVSTMFPLPPLAEQQRIVAKIEEAFAEIDAIEKNKELLKTHIKQTRQKILDLAIHGKLVPQNKSDEPASVLLERITRDNPHYEKIEDEPFEIPENWAWCRLGNLSESIQYGYNAPAKDSGRIKMVRISDIHENEVEWDSVPYCDIDDKEIQTYLLKKNDILFARTGGTVGKSFIVSNLPEDAVYAGYLIRTRYGKNANAQYMKYFMESNLYWEQLRDGCIATAQPNCNGKTLGKMQIPLPPLAEQSRIVAKIEELFSTLDKMERNFI